MNRRAFLKSMAVVSASALVPSGMIRAVESLLHPAPGPNVSLAGIVQSAIPPDLKQRLAVLTSPPL